MPERSSSSTNRRLAEKLGCFASCCRAYGSDSCSKQEEQRSPPSSRRAWSAMSKASFVNSKHLQAPALDGAQLVRSLSGYRMPSSARSVGELAITFIPLALLWIAAWFV